MIKEISFGLLLLAATAPTKATTDSVDCFGKAVERNPGETESDDISRAAFVQICMESKGYKFNIALPSCPRSVGPIRYLQITTLCYEPPRNRR